LPSRIHPAARRCALIALCASACLASSFASSFASSAHAQASPQRYFAALTAGVPLRLTRNVDLDQGTLAPLYSDVLAGYVLPGEDVRHGLGASLSLNLTADGGYTEPVAPGEQLALAPSYLLYVDLGPDSLMLGQAGLPIVLTGSNTIGLALSAALGYRLLAGVGVLAELGFETFVGVSSRLHPTVSLELGVFMDYEVLP
jgi:hypothetical protein